MLSKNIGSSTNYSSIITKTTSDNANRLCWQSESAIFNYLPSWTEKQLPHLRHTTTNDYYIRIENVDQVSQTNA